MNLLSDREKSLVAEDVRDLILSSDQEATQLRSMPAERLYGSDEVSFEPIRTLPLEFIETPPEDLAQKIDASACVLPDLDIKAEDRIKVGDDQFRVQAVQEERCFGVVTHKVIKLVRLHGS